LVGIRNFAPSLPIAATIVLLTAAADGSVKRPVTGPVNPVSCARQKAAVRAKKEKKEVIEKHRRIIGFVLGIGTIPPTGADVPDYTSNPGRGKLDLAACNAGHALAKSPIDLVPQWHAHSAVCLECAEPAIPANERMYAILAQFEENCQQRFRVQSPFLTRPSLDKREARY
jgi:hypothetical protein